MNLFFDTSALFKLYHQEPDSAQVEVLFRTYNIEAVFLSELTKLEFTSTTWKKFRTKAITELQANTLIKAFDTDARKYSFVAIDRTIIEQANMLLFKYGSQGLRTLDSIQLSTAVWLKSEVSLFKSADKLLDSFFQSESLPTS